ncbi:site-specific integrase [Colwellia sp. BRX8-9]|uniref:tyrosine-type recombinase/integrase n=1 Tax=Colwellia sp. BRX8-9 TaxID=2759831 RepID=UPI0015F6D0F1|nr:site-specific integrase [Colwellia sp. BRX8-9]MBA6348105.1 tyrosine-type recombinase/integrase [Colwellia sp. BRX8-9]
MSELVKKIYFTANKHLSEVIEDFVSLKSSHHTRRAYKGDLTQFFNTLDLTTLDELSNMHFSQLISAIRVYIESRKKIDNFEILQRVKNSRTINRKTIALRVFFDYLINVYRYDQNPLNQFQNLQTENLSSTASLSSDEVFGLLKAAKERRRNSKAEFRNYLILVFLFHLALRVAECANLQWKDLELSNQKVSINQKGGILKSLPIPHELCLLLKEFLTLYGNTCPFIFQPIKNNRMKVIEKPLSTRAIYNVVRKLAARVAPEKNITPHSLRKTFIELALDNGADLISICNATGHSSIEMVKYYDGRDKLKNNAIHSPFNMI